MGIRHVLAGSGAAGDGLAGHDHPPSARPWRSGGSPSARLMLEPALVGSHLTPRRGARRATRCARGPMGRRSSRRDGGRGRRCGARMAARTMRGSPQNLLRACAQRQRAPRAHGARSAAD
eukprot:scaffold1860_cov403-Prasinococcus_capsulatus_cf.AAC.21